MTDEAGTKESPWNFKTPPLTSDYQMYVGEKNGEKVIVCVVGGTTLFYAYRAIEDSSKNPRKKARLRPGRDPKPIPTGDGTG